MDKNKKKKAEFEVQVEELPVELENISYCRLDKEIKAEEESRKLCRDNIECFKKSQKPKGKLRNKIIAGITLLGILIGGGILVNDCQNGDMGFNNEIRSAYVQTIDTLESRLGEHTRYDVLDNNEITYLQFNEPTDEGAQIEVHYSGQRDTNLGIHYINEYAIFNVLLEYYNALVEAEEEGNPLLYLECLNKVFAEMEYEDVVETRAGATLELPENTPENIEIFNEIFKLDQKPDDVVRQIGFLPYSIEVVDYKIDHETEKREYTYKIVGISYCEVKSESKEKVRNSDKLIIESGYENKNIRAYHREMTFSSYTINPDGVNLDLRLSGDIYKIINGYNYPYTVETTEFQEIDLLKILQKIKNGENFKKPEDFNLQEYIKNQKELENT